MAKPESSKQRYDGISKRFIAGEKEQILLEWWEGRVRALASSFSGKAAVAVVGCFDARHLRAFERAGADAVCVLSTATDIDSARLLSPDSDFILSSRCNMKMTAESRDCAWICFAGALCGDIGLEAAEMRRILKPGGLLAVTHKGCRCGVGGKIQQDAGTLDDFVAMYESLGFSLEGKTPMPEKLCDCGCVLLVFRKGKRRSRNARRR